MDIHLGSLTSRYIQIRAGRDYQAAPRAASPGQMRSRSALSALQFYPMISSKWSFAIFCIDLGVSFFTTKCHKGSRRFKRLSLRQAQGMPLCSFVSLVVKDFLKYKS